MQVLLYWNDLLIGSQECRFLVLDQLLLHIMCLNIVQTEAIGDEQVYNNKKGVSWFQNKKWTFLFLIIYILLIFH